MRADLALLEQIESRTVLCHVEVPYGLLEVLPEAIDWLICAHNTQEQCRCITNYRFHYLTKYKYL